MSEPREISNPRTGQRMRFTLTGADTGGELLRIESVHPPTNQIEPLHVHPLQESRARVASGALEFLVDGSTTLLGPGEEITIPAGARHRFRNPRPVEAVSVQEFRPALRIQEFFEAFFRLAEEGELDDRGMPSLLRTAVMAPAFADEIRIVTPPWPVQRLVFGVLGPIARRRGFDPPPRA